jgi:hypothetical protein
VIVQRLSHTRSLFSAIPDTSTTQSGAQAQSSADLPAASGTNTHGTWHDAAQGLHPWLIVKVSFHDQLAECALLCKRTCSEAPEFSITFVSCIGVFQPICCSQSIAILISFVSRIDFQPYLLLTKHIRPVHLRIEPGLPVRGSSTGNSTGCDSSSRR